MSYAVMPLTDYKTACGKIREKVGIEGFEDTSFGYVRSPFFTVPESGSYTLSIGVKDEGKLDIYSIVYATPGWEGESSPGYFEIADNNTLSAYFYKDEALRIFISDGNGLKADDIVLANLSKDGEIIAEFAPAVTIKSGELAEKIDEVYEAGKQAENEAFWSNFFSGGLYGGMFAGGGWNVNTFKPIYPADKIMVTGTYMPANLFYNFNRPGSFNTELVDLAEFCEHVDFSGITRADYMFQNARAKNITIDFSGCTSMQGTFQSGNGGVVNNLTLKVNENCSFTNTFLYQSELREIRFTDDSVIGKSISFAQSTVLTYDSIMNIINTLKDYSEDTSGTVYTLTLGTTNLAKLTDEEKAIATEKGWSLA